MWHPTKNGDVTAADVAAQSGFEAWWACEKGHEWQRRVNDTARGRRCPWCFGQKLTPERSLASKYPQLAQEWHPTKNGNLTPDTLYPRSGRHAWWLCAKGHEWRAQVSNRVAGRGCPTCSNRRVNEENSLAATFPHLAAEWHPTKNGLLTPHDITAGASERVWWLCAAGHEWQTWLISRVNGNNCKVCSNRVAHPDYNLETVNPDLASQWHPTKNADLKPVDVTPSSSRGVWWQCSQGHEWKSSISNRHRGNGCPYCSGFKATPETSFATTNPTAAALWHPTKNGDLTPDQVRPRAGSKVWWQCRHGHEWRAAIFSIDRGGGCPYCLGVKATADNNLRALAPAVAAEWHPTKNGALRPDDFVPKAAKKVWWKCPEGDDHEWQAFIYARTRGQGCPMCSGRAVSTANNLAVNEPDVANQWHPTKNGDLTPTDVTPGSSKKAWWKCPEGDDHVWVTEISARVRNWKRRQGGCPFCAETGFRVAEPGWLYVLEGPVWGKFGITNNLEQRLRQHGQHGTFGALIESWYFEEGERARNAERKLMAFVSEAPTAPPDVPGHSESFPAAMTGMVLEEVRIMLERRLV